MEGTITIISNLSEQEFMENALNMRFSGYDPFPALLFYAFANTWHLEKLMYYWELLELK